MDRNIKLITFSDGSYGLRSAGKRLVNQGITSGLFNLGCEHWTLETIKNVMPEFFTIHKDYLFKTPRGLGNWIWKPAVLLYEMQNANDGDFIVMLDAGCQLNLSNNAMKRFEDYLKHASEVGFTLVQTRDSSFGFLDMSDRAWTKYETLQFLDPQMVNQDSNQIQSGVIVAFNSAQTRKFVNQWYEMCSYENYSLLKSPALEEFQHQNFTEHRWEQSILSLLAKSSGITPIPDETYWYPNWNDGIDYPIWTMRNRSGGDAFRRSPIDLVKIALAKMERLVR